MTYTRKRWLALFASLTLPIAGVATATIILNQQPERKVLHDPKEDDERLRPMIDAAWEEAKKERAGHEQDLGYCHQLWHAQKRILKEKYGIDWKSPAEMNPNIRFH